MKFNFEHVIKGNRYINANIDGQAANIQGEPLKIFPFEIVQGAVWLTNNGMEPLLENIDSVYAPFDPTNNTQASFTFTGNSPVCVRWKNAIQPLNELDLNAGKFFEKNFVVGDYYSVFSNADFSATQEINSISLFGQNYKNLVTTLRFSVTMVFNSNMPVDWDSMLKNVWVMLGGNYTNKQLLILKSYECIVNSVTLGIQSYNLTFESLNLNYSETGKEILQFINFSMPGDNYPFPALNESGQVILDPNYLNNSFGVTEVQEEHSYSYMFGAFNLIGGWADKEHILPPQKLLLWQALPPVSDQLQLNGSATNNYYFWWNAEPTQNNIASDWQTALSNATYNGYQRENVGGLTQNAALTQATNPLNSGVYMPYFNSAWTIPQNLGASLTFPQTTSKYFGAKSGIFTFTSGNTYNIAQLLNHNSIIYDGLYQFSNTIGESMRFSLSDIPIFGTLASKLGGGINPTFALNTDVVQKGIPLNLFSAISTYNLAQQLVSATAGYIHMNFWNEDENQNADGGKLNVSSMRYKLTDRYTDPTRKVVNGLDGQPYSLSTWDIYFGNDPVNGVYNTIYLGQTKNPDGSKINFPTPYYDNDQIYPVAPSPTAQKVGFYIAAYKSQGVGASNVSLTFYSNLNSLGVNAPVYWNVFKNNASVKKIYSMWTNLFSFSIYEGNITDKITVKWPAILETTSPTSPFNIATNIKVPLFLAQNGANQNTALINWEYTLNYATPPLSDTNTINANPTLYNTGLATLYTKNILTNDNNITWFNITQVNNEYLKINNYNNSSLSFDNNVTNVTVTISTLNLANFGVNWNGSSGGFNMPVITGATFSNQIFKINKSVSATIPANFWTGGVGTEINIVVPFSIDTPPLMFQNYTWSQGQLQYNYSLENFQAFDYGGSYLETYNPTQSPPPLPVLAPSNRADQMSYGLNWTNAQLLVKLGYDTTNKQIIYSYTWQVQAQSFNQGVAISGLLEDLPNTLNNQANFGLTLTNFFSSLSQCSKVGDLVFSIINSSNL